MKPKTTYIGMTYEEWHESQRAKGFSIRANTPKLDALRESQYSAIAREGMEGTSDANGVAWDRYEHHHGKNAIRKARDRGLLTPDDLPDPLKDFGE